MTVTDGDSDDDEPDDTDNDESGDGTSGPTVERSITEAIGDDLNEALNDDETAADLDRVVDDLAHGVSGPSNLPRTTGVWEEATASARLLARDVSRVLSDIKDDCEAAWIRRTDTGRFSVDRWATDPGWDADNVFDLFDPGAMDASSLDLVLVLDVSGSMSSENKRLAEATWAIRQAVDRIEGTVTCIGFGDEATLMFDKPTNGPTGASSCPIWKGRPTPTGACRDAHRIVADSQAANRIVIILTDGAWWNMGPATAAIGRPARAVRSTCAIGLGPQPRTSSPVSSGRSTRHGSTSRPSWCRSS